MFHQIQGIKEQIQRRYEGGKLSSVAKPCPEEFCNDLTLLFLNTDTFEPARFLRFPLPTIMEYLQKTHTYYLGKCMDEIAMGINLLTYRSDYKKYWKPVLTQVFSNYSDELKKHINEEENELFPYIKSLLEAGESGYMKFSFEQKLMLIQHLLNHTDEPENKLRALIGLLESKKDHFADLLSLNVLISKLKSFERDLIVHARLEEEVLIPRALELEKKILQHAEF
ncbi:MAG: hemerythrin domain-containing protein [Bacteroidota bacterium]